MNYIALTGRMTGAVPPRLAPAISGVSATLLSIGGSIGVAAVGSLYLALSHTGTAAGRDPATAVHAFAVTTAALAGIGVLAILAAHRATLPRTAPATPEQALDLAETELAAPYQAFSLPISPGRADGRLQGARPPLGRIL